VTSRYKLVDFDRPDVDEWRLFDREKDPDELVSVYAGWVDVTVVVQLKEALAHLRAELKVPAELPEEVYRALVTRAGNVGRLK
jgi:hypothetical protein